MTLIDQIHRFCLIQKKTPLRGLFNFRGIRLQSPAALAADLSERTHLVQSIPSTIQVRLSFQMLVLALAAYASSAWLYRQSGNLNVFPLMMITGAFAVPMACFVFFWEANLPRNINFISVTFILAASGICGFAITLLLFFVEDELIGAGGLLGASIAGPVEETAKLAAVVLLAGREKKYPWQLNGLLLGAASGVGFAAFETAGYAFQAFIAGMESGSYHANQMLIMRGVLSPFAHVIWTAASAGALWKVMAGRTFQIHFLKDAAFLRVFGICVILHMTWNSAFLLQLGFLKYAILGWLGWVLVLGLIQEGCGQIRDVQLGLGFRADQSHAPAFRGGDSHAMSLNSLTQRSQPIRLRWSSTEAGTGVLHLDLDAFASKGGRLTLGRSSDKSDLVIPDSSISRRHAMIRADRGGLLLISDLDSSNGVKVNGCLLRGNQEEALVAGIRITIGDVGIDVI